MNAYYPNLFQPGRIGAAEIKNRVVMTSIVTKKRPSEQRGAF